MMIKRYLILFAMLVLLSSCLKEKNGRPPEESITTWGFNYFDAYSLITFKPDMGNPGKYKFEGEAGSIFVSEGVVSAQVVLCFLSKETLDAVKNAYYENDATEFSLSSYPDVNCSTQVEIQTDGSFSKPEVNVENADNMERLVHLTGLGALAQPYVVQYFPVGTPDDKINAAEKNDESHKPLEEADPDGSGGE